MSKEERHLQTKIRMFEDILLRTKNPCQVDNIQMELTRITKMCLCGIVSSNIKMWEEPDGTHTRMNQLQTQPVFAIYGEKL